MLRYIAACCQPRRLSCSSCITWPTFPSHGIWVRSALSAHHRTFTSCDAAILGMCTQDRMPAGAAEARIAFLVLVLTTFRAVWAVPSVSARTSTRCDVQRGTIVADCLARTIFPCLRTLTIAEFILAPSCTTFTLRARRFLLEWLLSLEISRRQVVTDEILVRDIAVTFIFHYWTGMRGAAYLATCCPHQLRVMKTLFAFCTLRLVVVVVRLCVVPFLNFIFQCQIPRLCHMYILSIFCERSTL